MAFFWNFLGVFEKVFVTVHLSLFDPLTTIIFERFLAVVGFSKLFRFETLVCLNILLLKFVSRFLPRELRSTLNAIFA